MTHVSPSQIRLYKQDPEAWRERYIHGQRQPETAAQATGKAIHASLEAYLLGRDHESADARAMQALGNLSPYLDADISVELEISKPLHGFRHVQTLYGFADLVVRDPDCLRIIDHKCTSNPDRACKSEWELAHDIQLMCYAWALGNPGQRVQVTHHYIMTSGPMRSWMVSSPVLDWDEVESFWEGQVLPTIYDIDQEWEAQSAPATPKEGGAMILCVHCMPSKGQLVGSECVDVYTWLRDEIADTTSELGQPYSTVKFGDGSNRVVQLAHERGKLASPPAVLMLPDRSRLCELIEAELRPYADVVLNGVH